MKWKLPPARQFGWRMKTLESAKTRFAVSERNVYELDIEHAPIKGVTPRMLLWWFEHIDGTMQYQGKEYPRYHVWHPVDHIHWALARQSPRGDAGQGASFRIVEAFGGDLSQLVDSTEYVEKLNETGIRLVRRIAGAEVFSLQHDFHASGSDTIYVSHMRVGTDTLPHRWLFNYLVRPRLFTYAMGSAWLRHNIEEVGNFEFFLPALYAEYH